MNILNFIVTYWSDILLALFGLFALVLAFYKKDYNFIKSRIFELVTEAERTYGDGTGILKLTMVINRLYAELPKTIKLLVTEKQIVNLIEKILEQAKAKWQANEKLLK